MIAYLDTSVLSRAFLPDEEGHEAALKLISDESIVLVTGTWTRVEMAAALTRARRSGRSSTLHLVDAALAALDDDGCVAVVAAPQEDVEAVAFTLATEHGLRAMDAWHLACALVVLPQLAEADEVQGFATRDEEQGAAAIRCGLTRL